MRASRAISSGVRRATGTRLSDARPAAAGHGAGGQPREVDCGVDGPQARLDLGARPPDGSVEAVAQRLRHADAGVLDPSAPLNGPRFAGENGKNERMSLRPFFTASIAPDTPCLMPSARPRSIDLPDSTRSPPRFPERAQDAARYAPDELDGRVEPVAHAAHEAGAGVGRVASGVLHPSREAGSHVRQGLLHRPGSCWNHCTALSIAPAMSTVKRVQADAARTRPTRCALSVPRGDDEVTELLVGRPRGHEGADEQAEERHDDHERVRVENGVEGRPGRWWRPPARS